MRFVSEGIGELVAKELKHAVDVRIAVAFFNPDDGTMEALGRLTKLTLIVSEEFTINNPYKLAKLNSPAATIRSIPADAENGKLHAKVLIMRRRDGSHWVLLGSANLTWQGMFSNQEACTILESRDDGDSRSIRAIGNWFDSLLETAPSPDLEQATRIFDAKSHYVLVPRPPKRTTEGTGYWALKTTAGPIGKQHWPSFLAEQVIAVGWHDLPVDPSKVSDAQLRAAIKKTYSNEDVGGAAKKIRKFVDLKVGDIVVLCRGYAPMQQKAVHIYGLARVTGPFRDDRRTKWDWRFKHDAVIQVVDLKVPRSIVASALGKKSMMQTIHDLGKAGFERLAAELGKFGVRIEI